jgi:hypothetical protein
VTLTQSRSLESPLSLTHHQKKRVVMRETLKNLGVTPPPFRSEAPFFEKKRPPINNSPPYVVIHHCLV